MNSPGKKYDFLVVGAGLAGAVMAERLARGSGASVLVVEKRDHIAGNCHDFIHPAGMIVKSYGPHIYHTSHPEVHEYLSGFTEWNGYRHRVLAFHDGEYYPIPINMETVNRFFGVELSNSHQMEDFLASRRIVVDEVRNSRDVVVSKFGTELYRAFVEGYTFKQWDRFPHELDPSVLQRLPVRMDSNPYYFDDPWQGMPLNGYTAMTERILDCRGITLLTDTDYFDIRGEVKAGKIIYTGPLDRFFDYCFGYLRYRCIDFRFESHGVKSFQPNSVVNFPQQHIPYSRVTEFSKFYDSDCSETVICREFFNWTGVPSYPVMDSHNQQLAEKYRSLAGENDQLYLSGRLALYRYLNMDQVVRQALELWKAIDSGRNIEP
ncbi:MAG: UDP-galactopyranose mutase [Candidatus Wallbacteria bacterium HGW-Wallbacteria-1]|jgi:UDP-galactopyranose mutase|uniref:UDP-galactopyranose mutase n=1 Tax=Candidatus Wallbacteria bacterium HGW-Wallbacteria-1 TaxID=2013854 RepID=A0A2N1PR28_9BACT|nr:MAG: UDP-galactopyranose mutase [Candidatus Wallbacteria bacterium HGW-Wallbacteria-1]